MQLIVSLANSAAIMAALAMVYGAIQRTTLARQLRHLAMGLCFGLGATLAMLQPLTVAEGIIVDGRSLFVGFAAAFLGPIGAAAALVAGSITRLMIGGTGAMLGVIAMMISALMGLLWLTLRERCRMNATMCFMALGTMLTLSVIVLFFLPEPARSAALQTVPALFVYNVVGSIYLGKMLQRERDRARQERDIRVDAITDPLTGLLNRRALGDSYALACDVKSARGTGLLLIDLDHFKSINDDYGHDAGDIVLRHVGAALRQATRKKDSVLRYGGEEFVVVLPDVAEQDALQAAWRICESLRLKVALPDGRMLKVSASVGGAHWTQAQGPVDFALKQADESLYDAKRSGRNTVVLRRLLSFGSGESGLGAAQPA